MGNEGWKMTFLRLAYYRDSEWNFSVFEASLVWGTTEDRAAGNERERDRVRERERERERERDTRVSKNATRTRCVLVA